MRPHLARPLGTAVCVLALLRPDPAGAAAPPDPARDPLPPGARLRLGSLRLRQPFAWSLGFSPDGKFRHFSLIPIP